MAATINPTLLLVIALAPLVGAIVAGLFGKTLGRVVSHSVTTGSVALSCALSLYVLWQVMAVRTTTARCIPGCRWASCAWTSASSSTACRR